MTIYYNIKLIFVARGPLTIDSGGGNDYFPFRATKGDVNITATNGPKNVTIEEVIGDVRIDFQGSGDDVIHLVDVEGSLNIETWDDNDLITLDKFRGDLFFDMGGGNDTVQIDYLDGNGTVLGGSGVDLLQLDARGGEDPDRMNTMDGSHLNWNGGEGNDLLDMYFVSAGTTNLNIIGDSDGVNQVVARCINIVCNMLSRETFLANINSPGIERVNLDSTAIIYDLQLSLNGGDNTMYFDDVMCIMDVFGGDDNDSFFMGQIYNDVRLAIFLPFDVFPT